ncbi:SPOR domain-containing protein [Microvirga sp. 2TAF3]|uniref:SPOR domain-containing protein n=1 Tax=Microvirga sp. 2TAF3 TaxID=3233014 RepID=UPI003F9A8F63
MKPRFAVDLNEIERQIAQAQGNPAQSASTGRNDPLAELARIVGQDDPFQSLLTSEAPRRSGGAQPANLDDLFAVRADAAAPSRVSQAHNQSGQLDVPAYDPRQYARSEVRGDEQAYAYETQNPASYDSGAYGQDYYDEQSGHHAATGYDHADHDGYQVLEKPRSRKGFIAIGAVLGAAIIGAGGAFFLGGTSSAVTGGEPPLIKATNEPIKVQPQNPGGVEIPNQNKQIYERTNQNAETKVVTRTEQPVDVKQVARMNAASDATGATANPQQPANGLNLGEPRKVRTVTIRPDGSMGQADGGNARPAAPAAPPTMTMPTATQPPAAPAQPKPVAATPAAPAPKPAPVAEAPGDASPQPKPQRVASAQPTAIAPAAAAPADTASIGGFSVQLGLANSESAAQKSLAQLQRKYSDLDGQSALIRKAEVNGNTIYRVRVGPMSQSEASTLCSKLQGQGGQCFVAKN